MSKNTINLQNINQIIEKWRKILSIDPVYIINIETKPTSEFNDGEYATIDNLDSNVAHPILQIDLNEDLLNKEPEQLEPAIIHELCHIIVWESFIMANPKHKYKKMQARAEEILVMKITKALTDK